MNIKSLLLGSAAAAVAFTGAQAADAIVIAEPEPLEYVRICDAYGVGFFYIPGTETCLRIGGEIRYQVGTTNADDPFSITPALAAAGAAYTPAWFGSSAFPTIEGTDTPSYHGYVSDTWNKQARARFFIDARSQTEYGTLRGYVRIDANRGTLDGTQNGNGTSLVNTNKAFIELGGFKVGWEDSAWAFTPNAGSANYGSHSDSGLSYGYQQRNLIQYNFTGGNGFFATLSLEDDNMNGVNAARNATGGLRLPAYTDNNYMPDVVVKAGITQGWGAAWGAVGFDEDRTNAATLTGFLAGVPGYLNQIGDSGWAAQAGVHINVPNAPGSSFRVIGYYADSANAYNGHGGNWSILGSYWHQFTPNFGASIGAQYVDSLYSPGSDIKTDADLWQVELNTVWTPVKDFAIRGEAVYRKQDELNGVWSGFVRFSRFF